MSNMIDYTTLFLLLRNRERHSLHTLPIPPPPKKWFITLDEEVPEYMFNKNIFGELYI
jgi:hypothetical protein